MKAGDGIGARLQAERERLGLSRDDMATITGENKGVQFAWENDVIPPNALALQAHAKAGADVQFIVTGIRAIPGSSLGHDPAAIRQAIAMLPIKVRRALLADLVAGELTA